MSWAMVWVALAFAGLAVLAVCAIRIHVAVRGFGRELARTRARLAPKHAEISRELNKLGGSRE